MSSPGATDGGELTPSDTEVVESGRCRMLSDCNLCVVGLDGGYHDGRFTAGETLPFDRVIHRLKKGSTSTAFVVDAGERGKAYLLPVLWERYCERLACPADVQVNPIDLQETVSAPATAATRPARLIRVVNVKGLNKPDQRARIVYVGRKFAGWPAHPLANPFVPQEDEPPGECLRKYRAKLATRLTLERDLVALWAETGQGAKPIGCWCVNATAGDGSAVVCHGQVLAEMLRERFGAKA